MSAKRSSSATAVEATMGFDDAAEFTAWLRREYASSTGIWLKLAKQGAGVASVTYAEAIDVALCYGWIDGHKKPLDARFWLQRFSPRKAASVWSKINRDKVARLIEQKRMRAPGLAAIERAKQNGQWERAYDGAKTATTPADLQTALDENPGAKAFFATLNGTNRYAVLWRIQTAKKPETRTKRIAQLVAMLARNEKPHP